MNGSNMAIKDKDGNVYKLRGPNPLVKNRSDWDRSKMKLINMGEWKSETIEDHSTTKYEKENTIDIAEELDLFEGPEQPKSVSASNFIQELAQQEPEIKSEPIPEVTINVDRQLARVFKERGVEYYCAPVIGKNNYVDDLYGETYSTLKYGDKFLFDAVIIDQSDLQLQFWCVKHITKDSVVYRKHQHGGERWWRVNSLESKTGGYLCLAHISDVNPDFT